MSAQAILFGAQAGLQLASGYFQSQSIKDAAALNREIADANAEFAELDAYDALVQGETVQSRYQSVIDQTLSDQNTIAAAQGLDTGFGTSASLREEDEFNIELNMMEIQKRAQEQALGLENQAAAFRTQGILQEAQADVQAGTALFSGVSSAISTGLTGYARSQ